MKRVQIYICSIVYIQLFILCLSCVKRSNVKVALFFNPSYAFDMEQQYLRVEIDNDLIVDTNLNSTWTDKSLLIKCFEIPKSTDKNLRIKINEKDTTIHLNEISTCISIFTSYDDHTRASEMKYELTVKKEMLGQDFKDGPLLDSILQNKTGDKLDSLEVTIKRDTCRCEDKAYRLF